MKIEVPDSTAAEVQAMLAQQGEDTNVEAFVQRTLAKRLLQASVRELRACNRPVSGDEIESDIAEALGESRTARRSVKSDADRS